jgi:Tfp pilus assembly protein PilO
VNPIIDRTLFSHLIVIIGVCVGAWVWQVQPRMKQLGMLQQRIEANQSTSSAFTAQAVEAAAKRLDAAKLRLAQIEASNSLADDSSRFYGLVMDLADEHGVQIKSLQPRTSNKVAADATVLVTRIDLSIEGAYKDVANFLAAMSNLPAFTSPLSLQLTPNIINNKPLVTANFSCGLLKFPIPQSLTSLAGATHGNP